MKRLLTAALLAVFVSASAFATDANKINVRIKNNFNAEFQKATNVNWSLTGMYAKASFTNDEVKMEAFYDLDGTLIGTSKNIAVDKLPTSAKRMFAKKYADYTIKEAILFENNEETAYYISAENNSHNVIFKVKDTSNFSIFQKDKKK